MSRDEGLSGRILVPDVAELALAGLLSQQKTLPAKLFYDEKGCELFSSITRLSEYYLTRTERALLTEAAPSIIGKLSGEPSVLVEYGASDEAKASLLLSQRGANDRLAICAYVPIDVAALALRRMHSRLRSSCPQLLVHTITADFLEPILLPDSVAGMPRLGLFPGSTIGNLEPATACTFLTRVLATLGQDAHFLVGADRCRDPTVLIPAYADAAGVTEEFNRNLLVRLNREAGANFDVSAFEHRAEWNSEESRIEMHLVSRCNQTVDVAGKKIHFAFGETIHTENSYKYTPDHFLALAASAGWKSCSIWSDPDERFVLYLLVPNLSGSS